MNRAIRAGRHALSELVVDQFIPNGTSMHADTARVQVLPTAFINAFLMASALNFRGLHFGIQN